MNLDERIAQFRNMAEADPDNDMAHFSLGNALLQADRFEEAAASLERCFQINDAMSKAYQLAGEAYVKANRRDDAIRVLTEGYTVASSKGDLMPRNAMGDLLRELDAPVPEVEVPAELEAPTDGSFMCQVSGRPGDQLEKPPFKGALGQKIYETVSAQSWRAWIEQGTKVINELRLDLSREDHQEVYDQHMMEFLGLEAWAAENLKASN